MGITTKIPTNLDFPHRGVLERDAFVLAQETAQDLLAGGYTTALNQYAVELNATQTDINTKAEQVANQAVDGGYSQVYIDSTFTPKILNTQTDKTTPIDADLIPLSDSASSFGLKKLRIVNLITKAKNDIISAFGVLISGLTAKVTPIDDDMIIIADSASSNASKKLTFANLKAMIFINSALTGTPTAPTQTAGDNSTKVATTAFVKAKSEADSIGVGQTWQDVTASRSFGVNYTNTTGKPIMCSIRCINTSLGSFGLGLSVDGIDCTRSVADGTATTSFATSIIAIVPNGSTYRAEKVGGATQTNYWIELR